MGDLQGLLRALPAVQDLLRDSFLAEFEAIPRALVVAAIQDEIAAARERMLRAAKAGVAAGDEIAVIKARVAARLTREKRPGPARVFNATGVIVHTNLGRAPLAASVADHVRDVAVGYSTLEYDVERGARGSRQTHVEALLVAALECEAALAVNNNAAAVMLALAALAAGREVIVSRGELVEIGGSFRVPEILRAAGARLVEVGTTNRTTAKDYAAAIGPDTAMLLKVHPSNFRVVGFTTEATLPELAVTARTAKVPLVFDAGSGMLLDLPATDEPSPKRALAHCDLVTFSGDKLLGGPQAGVIAGKKSLVERAKKHPLARAVRIDKLSLAALAATLRLVLDPARASEIPVIRMCREPVATVKARAERLSARLGPLAAGVVETEAQFGGGSMPGETIPSFAVALRSDRLAANALEAALRAGDLPVIARIHEGSVLLDARTLGDDEIEGVAAQVASAMQRSPAGSSPT